jgi:hypothetical protein
VDDRWSKRRARFAVAAEESLERKYRLEPGPEVRERYRQAATALVAALDVVHGRGDREDRLLAQRLEAQHARCLAAIGRMFAAVDMATPTAFAGPLTSYVLDAAACSTAGRFPRGWWWWRSPRAPSCLAMR